MNDCAAATVAELGSFGSDSPTSDRVEASDDSSFSPSEKRRRRKAIFRDFYYIWQAKRLPTLLQRYLQVVRRYRTTQPEAVRCLRADFRATIAYFALHHRHPDWKIKHLRTTSRLERFNRRLRRRTRAASAYHSEASLQATLAHEVKAFHNSNPHL